MAIFRSYLGTFKSSTFSLAYYAGLAERPFKASLYFFLVSLVIFSLVTGLIRTRTLLFPLRDLLAVLPDKLAQIYPEDLTLKIQSGNLSINQPEPYLIPLDRFDNFLQDLKHQIKGVTTARPTYFLVIDTQASLAEFQSYQTFMLLTKNNLIYFNRNGHAEIIPLSNLTDMTINHQIVSTILQKLTPAMKSLWVSLFALFILASTLLIPLANFILASLFTLIFIPIKLILRLKLSFKALLQINLHLWVPFTFVTGLISLVTTPFPLPGFQFLILGLIELVLLISLKESSLTEATLPVSGNGPQ